MSFFLLSLIQKKTHFILWNLFTLLNSAMCIDLGYD